MQVQKQIKENCKQLINHTAKVFKLIQQVEDEIHNELTVDEQHVQDGKHLVERV